MFAVHPQTLAGATARADGNSAAATVAQPSPARPRGVASHDELRTWEGKPVWLIAASHRLR